MKRKVVKLFAAGAALALAGSFGAVSATGAEAATGTCSGTLVGHNPLSLNGTTYAYLDVYYNSTTGYNCARTVHYGSTWGKPLFTSVTLNYVGRQGIASDSGTYAYYAGPVSLYGRGICVEASANISPWPSSAYEVGAENRYC
ncbi:MULTISPECIES: hypothetical protein [Arthrobacter]|uniref:Spore-associated protein A n=2 Tax=Arthrobacter TaxID=1663 RepID=A0ABU9KFS3_9MICC|nr:hypothetical protein [Arthrobacter sp. YJM1]MDP5225725.1 hypothetical protein [Arthrobacter sp. YJM1]